MGMLDAGGLLGQINSFDASVTEQLRLVGLVVLAVVLGALIGAEREFSHKSAGLRTHALVAAGSAVAVVVGQIIYQSAVADGEAGGDPARALHAVLTGIGFIGAGAIIRPHRRSVEGLTTAASLWFAAAVGIATGLGLLIVAIGSTVVGLGVLSLMRPVDRMVKRVFARIEGDPEPPPD